MAISGTLSAPVAAPAFIADWFARLQPRPMAEVVDAARTALFCTDMTVGFCDRGNLSSPRIDALPQDTHHPQATEFQTWPPHCVRGTEEAETIPELKALPFAELFTVIEKNSLHPAIGTSFDSWLDAHPELRTAIVSGDCTDLCVYQLAMHLRLRHDAHNVAGMRVIVPADAVNTFDLPAEAAKTLNAMPHPGDFFHQVFLYHMALNGIEVVRALT